ncbi:MAG: hypothetical protein KDN05_10955 [Verrucomicrobiae bacterium]|nr:hypothetical protein [Verrucomicrobiae bacterium]
MSKAKKPGNGRYFGPNPLPEGVCGEQLLVDLKTEAVIKKLGLKENWEVPGGWDYLDLRALVARALGEPIATDDDQARAAEVQKRTAKALLKKIRKAANIPLTTGEASGEFPLSEAYWGLLVLGLGADLGPLDPKVSQLQGLADQLAELLHIDPQNVSARGFENAKRKLVKDYEEHLERQGQRKRFREPSLGQANEGGPFPVKQADMIAALRAKFEAKGSLGSEKGSEDAKKARAILLAAGVPKAWIRGETGGK